MNFQPYLNLKFSLYFFKPTFIWLLHLWTSGLSHMVFEHFLDLFDPKDSTNDFLQVFQMTSMLLQIISQGPLFQLLVLQGFWLLPNLLEAFGQLWWVRSCIDW